MATFVIGDSASTKWNGSLQVGDRELLELVGYEMGLGDVIGLPRRCEMSTRPAFQFNLRSHHKDILVDGFSGAGNACTSIERLTQASQPDISHKTTRGRSGAVHLVWQCAWDNRFDIH